MEWIEECPYRMKDLLEDEQFDDRDYEEEREEFLELEDILDRLLAKI